MAGAGLPEVQESPLDALRKFKQGQNPAPATQSGSVNPFGDLALKKKEATAAASQNGSQPSENGSGSSQSSPLVEAQFNPNDLAAQQAASAKRHGNIITPEQQQQFVDKQNSFQAQLSDPGSQYYQDKAKQQADFEKAHPGSWSNALPTFGHALVGLITKPVAGLAHITSDLYQNSDAYDPKKVNHIENFAKGLDSYNNYTEQSDINNPLPNTFFGNLANAGIHIAPIAGTAALFPEAEAAESAEGINMASLQKLNQIANNSFTKISAIKGGLDNYDQARQSGLSPLEASKQGAKGFVTGGADAAMMNILGSVAGDAVSPNLAKGFVKSGIIENGKLSKMGADAISDAMVFGAYPVVTHLLTKGTLPSKEEVEQQMGIGGAFGVIKALGTGADFTDADNELIKNKQGLALQNFIDASPDAIQEAYKLPQSAADINAQAIDYAAQANKETDLAKRKELIAASSTYTKASNVKSVAQSILANRQGFIDEINNSDFAPEQKTALIDKINQVQQTLDPLEQQKTALGQQYTQADESLKNMQEMPEPQEPVAQAEREVAIDRLQKQKEQAKKELVNTINQQHDEHVESQEVLNQANIQDLASRIVKGEPITSPQDLQLQANYPNELETAIKKEGENPSLKDEKSPIGDEFRSQLKYWNDVISNPDSGDWQKENAKKMLPNPIEYYKYATSHIENQYNQSLTDSDDGDYSHYLKKELDLHKSILSKLQEGENNNAISIGSPASSDVGETPGNSPKVGERIPEPEEPAVSQAEPTAEVPNGETQENDEQINSPLNTENNENTESTNNEENGSKETNAEKSIGNEVGRNGNEKAVSEGGDEKPPKLKIKDNQLLQPSKLGDDYHLVLAEKPDGSWVIADQKSGITVSKDYEDGYAARLAYSKNREKLTPEKLKKAKEALDIQDETPPKEVTNLSDKGKKEVNDALQHNGITYDNIKDYERARLTGLPESGRQATGSVPQDVQSTNNESAGENKDIQGEAVREEPVRKSDALEAKLKDAKADLSQAVKKSRGQLNMGLNPDLVSKFVGVIKAYADLGIHKFGEIVRDWVNTFGKDNVADEDFDALKSAYAAHVADLPKEQRAQYNSLKELDDFMKNDLRVVRGQQPKASLPEYTPREEPRLPTPKEEETETPKEKAKFTKLSGLRSYAIRNLEQLKAFSKSIKDYDPLRAVRQYASSKSQASVLLKTATKGITDLIGKQRWEQMRQALVESRLRGIKDRWNRYADDVANMPDDKVKTIFDDGDTGNMYDLVKNLKQLQGEANPGKFAVSLIASGRYGEAKEYLSNVFKQAADNVLTLGIPFDDMVKDGKFVDPKMQQALETYKNLLEKPIAESHENNEGIFSEDLGDLNTYYPLIAENSNAPRLIGKGKPYNEPDNILNRFATGQSDRYSAEISDLGDKLTAAIKTNNKANAIDALKKVGLITEVSHNAPDTEKIQIGNDVFDAVKEKVAEGRTIIQDGQIVNTKSKYVMIPKWLKGELDPIFNSTDQYDKYNAFGKAFNLLTKVALGGPTEAVAHAYRLLGVITNSVPFMQEWAYKNGAIGDAGGYVANNPFVKKWTGLFKILNTDISSDKALQSIQEMSKLGIIPEKTWTKTWSREFAELTGAKASRIKIGKMDIPNFTDFSPVLYGKNSIDLKARVMMYNLTKAMNPDATPEQHVKMQNELGVYTKALQSDVERKIKESGLFPYYSFGSSVYRSGLKSVFGASPLPTEGAGNFVRYKAAQLITNGVIGSVASWALIYHASTGNWPWEDETSKLGRIPFPDWAKNDLSEKFFTDKTGNYEDIDLWRLNNPIFERGARVVGAEKAYETNQLGGTPGQTMEAGATQQLNTALSPFTSSPAIQLASTAITGSAPYVTGLRDDKGKPSPQLFKKVKAVPYGTQPVANSYSALKEANPFTNIGFNMLNNATGYEKSLFGLKQIDNSDRLDDAGSPLGFIMNMAVPYIFTPHGNDEAKKHYIEKNQQDLEKTISKEQEKEGE